MKIFRESIFGKSIFGKSTVLILLASGCLGCQTAGNGFLAGKSSGPYSRTAATDPSLVNAPQPPSQAVASQASHSQASHSQAAIAQARSLPSSYNTPQPIKWSAQRDDEPRQYQRLNASYLKKQQRSLPSGGGSC